MRFAFDIEVYKNFFSMVAVDVDSSRKIVAIIYKDRNDYNRIKKLYNSGATLIGFNSEVFDLPVLEFLLEQGPDVSLQAVWQKAQQIVNARREDYTERSTRARSIDLMQTLSLDGIGVSLKQAAINLKWYWIEDLPIPFDSLITDNDVDEILKYNENDVLITKKLAHVAKSEISLREEVSEIFNIDVVNASDSRMANLLLEKIYADRTGIPPAEFKKQKTFRKELRIGDCIAPGVKFYNHKLIGLKTQMANTAIEPESSKAEINAAVANSIRVGDTVFNIGVGGLHSDDSPALFRSTKDALIIDADVASFYPSIMLRNEIKPAHLDYTFVDIYRRIVDERLDAKRTGQKAKAEALKITINSVFGKLGSKYSWLYDPQAFYFVTISGQLYLLMLIEMLSNAGIEVISANTDGITSRVKVEEKDIYDEVCKNWQTLTGFTLEFANYRTYVRRDVNNYLVLTDTGTTKAKGMFEVLGLFDNPRRSILKRLNMDVLPRALIAYFFEGIPPEEFVMSEKLDIFDFLLTQRVSEKFYLVWRHGYNEQLLQKTVRFYVSDQGGGEILKIGDDGSQISLCAGYGTVPANYIAETEHTSYPINYDYYIAKIREVIEKITPTSFKQPLF